MMIPPARKFRLLLVDEDPALVSVLAYRIEQLSHAFSTSWKIDPLAEAGHDVYIVDHQFKGSSIGCDLIEQIRIVAPQARIYLYSDKLTARLLKEAIAAGISGAFDKRDDADTSRMLLSLSRLAQFQAPATEPLAPKTGFIGELSELLSRWNERLTREEAARQGG